MTPVHKFCGTTILLLHRATLLMKQKCSKTIPAPVTYWSMDTNPAASTRHTWMLGTPLQKIELQMAT